MSVEESENYMKDFLFSIITHPAFGIVTTFIGFLIGNYFAIGRDRRKEFNEAANKFTLAFQNTLSELRHNGRKSVYDIITPELINHQTAYTIFCRYLHGNTLKNFNLAWKDYFTHAPHPGEERKPPEYHYSEWEDAKERTFVIQKIENLLEFAKLKK